MRKSPFSCFLITVAVVFDGIIADDRHILKPKSLNGHYINWPIDWSGTMAHRDQDTPQPPPPNVQYMPNNMIFTRVQMAGDRAFVVCPRFRPGVPFTLGYVPLTDCATSSCIGHVDRGYQMVSPYPSLHSHCQLSANHTVGPEKPCDGSVIVNAVDLYLGPDGVLWVLDIGVVDTALRPTDRMEGSANAKYADPKVWGIDVATGKTVHDITLRPLTKSMNSDMVAKKLCTIVVEYDAEDNNGDCGNTSRDGKKSPMKPVAVYVGDVSGRHGNATAAGDDDDDDDDDDGDGADVDDGDGAGSIVVWLMKYGRGIRVVLPASVSAVRDRGRRPLDDNGLHLALLDDPRRRDDAGPANRYLYFTYGRHPDAYKIPVLAIRSHVAGHAVFPVELKLRRRVGIGDTRADRCVVNVGRKPHGPLVPVGSALGSQWYFRNGDSDVYVWDVHRPFHAENFRLQVAAGNAFSTAHSDYGRQTPDAGDPVDYSMQVTSVDYAYGSVNDGGLWALRTNFRDWWRGRTGRFGPTALLGPVTRPTGKRGEDTPAENVDYERPDGGPAQ